jgi:hypothetical protein
VDFKFEIGDLVETTTFANSKYIGIVIERTILKDDNRESPQKAYTISIQYDECFSSQEYLFYEYELNLLSPIN